jgi:glycosyltransferase involved in cell wall biosynthesis
MIDGSNPLEGVTRKDAAGSRPMLSETAWPNKMGMNAKAKPEEVAVPRVSIILPLYNAAGELPVVLEGLNGQSFRDWEIILVDDGSTDETWKTASTISTGRNDIILSRTDHRGPAHARNVGLQHSRGEIIFFSESDCVYDPEYLQRAVDTLDSHAEAGAVCLTGAPLVTRTTLGTRCIEIENKVQHRLLSQGKIEPFYAWVYRRNVLMKLGGFDDRLFQGEDRDLFRRLKDAKYSVALVPGVNWQHVRDQTMGDLSRKWFGRGRTRLLYLFKHRRVYDITKSILPFWATVTGLALIPFFQWFGAVVLLLVFAAFMIRTLRVLTISWPLVQRKRNFLGYPFFIIARNFSTAVGYSLAMVVILVKRLQGKDVTWDILAPENHATALDV